MQGMSMTKKKNPQPYGHTRGGNQQPMIVSMRDMYLVREPQYRIRKLTPLECWRFMGFSDEDFQKAEKVNSNSQLYKQAGNSIVKDVLMAIFGQMMPEGGEINGIRRYHDAV